MPYFDVNSYEPLNGANEVVQERSFLSQPRPLNPELDIHIDPESVAFPPLNHPNPQAVHEPYQPKPKKDEDYQPKSRKEDPYQPKPRKDEDYQLAIVPSSDSSSSANDRAERWTGEAEGSLMINAYLQKCGLPSLDFDKLSPERKDEFVELPD